MFVTYTRLTNESFGKYNLPPDWRYESIDNYQEGKTRLRFFGPDPHEWTDDVKDSVYMKFSELVNEGIVKEFRIHDKIENY